MLPPPTTTTCFGREHRACSLSGSIGAHQVHAGQVLVGAVDALEVLAGDAHEHRQAGPVGDEDGVEALFLHQFVDGVGLPDDHVADDLDAQLAELVRLRPVDDLLGQAELGDAVDQHAAGLCAGPRRW